MEVLILQAFVSLMLVGGALLLFIFSWRQRDHEHADRLALLPAEHDGEGPLPRTARADDRLTTDDGSSTAEESK